MYQMSVKRSACDNLALTGSSKANYMYCIRHITIYIMMYMYQKSVKRLVCDNLALT